MERKCEYTQASGVYPSQGKVGHDIPDKTAGTKPFRSSGEEIHDVTHTTVFG